MQWDFLGVPRRIIATLLMALLALFFVFPMLLTVVNSFMEEQEIMENYSAAFGVPWYERYGQQQPQTQEKNVNIKIVPDNATLSQYYTVLFKSPTYLLKFWNSVLITGSIVLGQLLVGALAAYAFSKLRSKWIDAIFLAYIIMMLMPFQVTLVPNYLMADWLGLLDTMSAVILPGVFATFGVFLLRQFMQQVPSDYLEAARLDGANEFTIFRRVVLPMCKPGLASLAILTAIDAWNMVEQPLILLRNAEMHPLSVFLSKINQGELGIAFAAASIYMIPMILIFLYGEKYLVQGILHSGVKS